jgi:hypothetical protein
MQISQALNLQDYFGASGRFCQSGLQSLLCIRVRGIVYRVGKVGLVRPERVSNGSS